MNRNTVGTSSRLTEQVGLPAGVRDQTDQADEHAWIEVIRRMDEIYADLVNSQVALEQKNSELEDARRFIESVISSMSDILIVCDIDGNILQTNQALENCLQIEAETLIGQPLTVLFEQNFHSMVSEFSERIRSGGINDCEVDLIDRDKQPVPMSLNCSARFDHDNRLSGLVITGRPLGELRKAFGELHVAHEKLKMAQQQLVQSEKMASLGRLVAGVAHELNNPISFLFANMHALKGYQTKFQRYIDAIHGGASRETISQLRTALQIDRMMRDIEPLVEGSLEGAERVTEIVRNLRRFSTPQPGRRQTFDLVTVIERALSWVAKAGGEPLPITRDLPPTRVLTNNEGHVHQILVNLIQNAADAMSDVPEPHLKVILREVEDQVHVVIQDNGHGIREDDMVRIFDPFFTTKPVGSGTGLGLYISLGLATEQCQGDLQAANRSVGGAEFILTLPLETRT